ncbi:MAG: NYN domain-containing protein [Streptosporangiaceae bacterium]
MDRCALFVDAGYALADGGLAVHGTRHRDSVTWDYAGLLKLLAGLSRDRTGLPVLRCYWYEAAVDSRRTAEHDVLADIPGLKLRLGKARPGRREGVETEIRRDLTALARNKAVSDVIIVSAEEDLAQVISEVQDQGVRVVLVHIAADGDWTVSRSLRQECDDIIEISAGHLRPYVDLIPGAEPAIREQMPVGGGYRPRDRQADGDNEAGRPGLADYPSAQSQPPMPEQSAPAQPSPTQVGPAQPSPVQPSPAQPSLGPTSPRPPQRVVPQDPSALPLAGPAYPTPVFAQYSRTSPPLSESDRPDLEAPGHNGSGHNGSGTEDSGSGIIPPAAGLHPAPDNQEPEGPHSGDRQASSDGQLVQPTRLPAQYPTPEPSQRAFPQNGLASNGLAPNGISQNDIFYNNMAHNDLPDHDLPRNGLPANSLFPHDGTQNGISQMPRDDALPQNGRPAGNGHSPGNGYLGGGLPSGNGSAHSGSSQGHGMPPSGLPQGGLPQRYESGPGGTELLRGGGLPQHGQAGQRQLPGDPGQQYSSGLSSPYGEPAPPQPAQPPQQPTQSPYGGGYGSPVAPSVPYPPRAPEPYGSSQLPATQQSLSQQSLSQPIAVSLPEAVQAAHAEGAAFGEVVSRDAPALWLEAVLARKPRMPSDLEARLLQGSGLPIDSLLHDEVRHALRRGFWDALEGSRR